MDIGSNLRKLRNGKSLSQKDLAEQLCVSPQAVSRWENDEVEPDISTLTKLCSIFGVTLDELINGSEKTDDKEEIVVNIQENKNEENKNIESANVELLDVNNSIDKDFKVVEKDQKKKVKNNVINFGIKSMVGGVVAFIAMFIIAMIINLKSNTTGASIGWSLLWAYGALALVYCFFSGSYIEDVFTSMAGTTIKFPGIIFSWSFDGIKFLILMKLLFAVLGFLLGIFFTVCAVFISAFLSMVSFPFVLIHNIINGAEGL